MGIKYSSSDSQELIETLNNNINVSLQITSKLMSGSNHLISKLNSKELSGAAYKAGSGLMKEIIIPTIKKVRKATEDVQSDLKAYQSAHGVVAEYPYLDSEQLAKELAIKQQQIESLNMQLERNKQFFNLLQRTFTGDIGNVISENIALQNMRDQILQPQVEKIKEKIAKLEWFNSATSSLFKDSLNAFQLALKGTRSINQISFDSSGKYYTNGADLTWFSKLEKQYFYTADPNADYSGVGQYLEDIGKIQRIGNLQSAYLGKTPKVKDSDKLQDLTVGTVEGGFGKFEFVKISSSNSVLSIQKSLKSNSMKTYGTKATDSNFKIGDLWGGSVSLIAWTPPKDSKVSKALSSVNFSKLNLGYSKNINPKNLSVGVTAQEVIADAKTNVFSFSIPNTGKTISFDINGGYSYGVSSHLTNNDKEGFSTGTTFGAGPTFGVTLKIK